MLVYFGIKRIFRQGRLLSVNAPAQVPVSKEDISGNARLSLIEKRTLMKCLKAIADIGEADLGEGLPAEAKVLGRLAYAYPPACGIITKTRRLRTVHAIFGTTRAEGTVSSSLC